MTSWARRLLRQPSGDGWIFFPDPDPIFSEVVVIAENVLRVPAAKASNVPEFQPEATAVYMLMNREEVAIVLSGAVGMFFAGLNGFTALVAAMSFAPFDDPG